MTEGQPSARLQPDIPLGQMLPAPLFQPALLTGAGLLALSGERMWVLGRLLGCRLCAASVRACRDGAVGHRFRRLGRLPGGHRRR